MTHIIGFISDIEIKILAYGPIGLKKEISHERAGLLYDLMQNAVANPI